MHSVHAGSSPVLGTSLKFSKRPESMFADIKVDMVPVFLFALLTGSLSGVKAQEVIVCKTQQDGIPRGGAIEWQVESFPVQLTLFYHNGKTTISERHLNFIVEPENGLGIGPFEESIVVSQGRNWASVLFEFPKAGKYVVSAFRNDQSVMAATHITIEGPAIEKPSKEEEETVRPSGSTALKPERTLSIIRDHAQPSSYQVSPSPEVKLAQPLSDEEMKTLHFAEVNIGFGTGVSGRKLADAGSEFTELQTRKGLVVQLSNNKPFATESVMMDVWRKSGEDTDYDEMVFESSVAVNAKSYTVQTPLTLFKKGDYKVSFFTSDFVWIGSGYVSVK